MRKVANWERMSQQHKRPLALRTVFLNSKLLNEQLAAVSKVANRERPFSNKPELLFCSGGSSCAQGGEPGAQEPAA